MINYRSSSNSIRSKVGNFLEKIEYVKWSYFSKNTINSNSLNNTNISSHNDYHRKYWGALVYDSSNIGDEIQTLASIGLIPSTERLFPIHREYLDKPQFLSHQQSTLPIIVNGWFTHLPNNWPIHDSLKPIFVGFHISRPELAQFKYREYYDSVGPIGCRDTMTMKQLESIGVETFFSGCPTITLKRPNIERNDKIIVVDSHIKKPAGHIPNPTHLLSSLIPSSILEKAEFVTHNVENYKYRWHGYKLKKAVELLKLYASAKIVITSRLHCALPCLAFGTPCIFLHPNLDTDPRLVDYKSILNGYSSPTDKINIDWNSPEVQDVTDFQNLIHSSIDQKFKDML
ncbi:MAG: polysaccharide pyruvyl transferase family protein [Aphanizomenon gracile PMC627.10]|nr:polysaccharide pyruvyl transferase family protein [Aphanizomenon gracile PMC627.10]